MYQFVLVGVDNAADVGVAKATWGTNKKFGGPQNMPVSAALAGSIGNDFNGSGSNYSSIAGTFTWKGFVSLNPIADEKRIDQKAVIQVALTAKAAATRHDTVGIVGITGTWSDDGDGILNAPDTFSCTGNGSALSFIK